ncbi:hypothetical protein LINGRAHAP2_LOCUS36745 [Linum grandiflorum]
MDWMEKKEIKLAHDDLAGCLDLICKIKGITEAENYFNELAPSAKKNPTTYGKLTNNNDHWLLTTTTKDLITTVELRLHGSN